RATERKGAGHARPLRETHRRGVEENRRRLPQAPTEAYRDRSAGGETAGPEHAGGRSVRGAHRYGGGRLGPVAVAEGRAVARLGAVERRLLPAAQQRDGLERRGSLAGLHSAHRSRGGVSDSQERSGSASGLAPEGGARGGAHPGLLSGLRAVEGAGPDVPRRGTRG